MSTLAWWWMVLREAASDWRKDNASRLSAALAFYTILSVAPLFVLVTAVAGFVFGNAAATGQLAGQIRGVVGEAGAEVFQTTIAHADRPAAGTLASLIGVVTLLFGASGVFRELQEALNAMWEVQPKPDLGFWTMLWHRLLSFGMVLALGFLLLVSLIVSTALSALGGYLSDLAPALPPLTHLGNVLVSFLGVATLFAMMFKWLPDAKVAWRDVWFGAVVTAVLFGIGKELIGLYLGKASVATPFGAAGSVVAFVVWVYYSGLIFFFGAELTQATARHSGRAIEPANYAEVAGRETRTSS